MPGVEDFLIGEHPRTLDERYRVSIPSEFADLLTAESTDCILAKERPGCLSLWSALTGRPGWMKAWNWSSKKFAREGFKKDRRGAIARPSALDQAPNSAIGRTRTVANTRGFSRVPRRGAKRRNIDYRSGSVHRNLAVCRMDQISGNKDAQV